MKLLKVGYGNAVVATRIKQISELRTAGGKRWKKEADETGRLIDATAGHHTKALLITDSGHIILSSRSARSLKRRLAVLLTKT